MTWINPHEHDRGQRQCDERDQQILALQEQLAEQRERADAAEARLADLTAELESMRQSALEWQAYAESLASAKAFIDAYSAAGYAEPFSAYGVFTYDATNVIIDGLAKTVGTGTWSDASRATLIENVGSTDLAGASGPLKFDEFGDTTNKVLTVYVVKDGAWSPVEGSTSNFQG